MPLVTEVTLHNEKFSDLIHPPGTVIIEYRNTTDIGIRVRCMGVHLNSNSVVDLDPGESLRLPNMGSGERVVSAWDAVTLDLVFVARYDMTQNGRVRITNLFESAASMGGASGGGATAPVSASPVSEFAAMFQTQDLEPLD